MRLIENRHLINCDKYLVKQVYLKYILFITIFLICTELMSYSSKQSQFTKINMSISSCVFQQDQVEQF